MILLAGVISNILDLC